MNSISAFNKIIQTALLLLYVSELSSSSAFFKPANFTLISKEQCQYKCDSDECIDPVLICDGTVDCRDGSDEAEELCSRFMCPAYSFQCKYGACISKILVCDGKSDCHDDSDEELPNCPLGVNHINSSTTREKRQAACEFRCDSGECISLDFLCDSNTDCADGSDETRTQCASIRCPAYSFQCKYGACISKSLVCDGKSDCHDDSDEELPNCPLSGNHINSSTTREKRQAACEFRCDSGECISSEFLCDGNTDCADGSDETRTRCAKIRCPPYLFQCKYGACILKNQVCDGQKNCADNSDEEPPNCNKTVAAGSCSNFEFRCKDGQCIEYLDTCDGVKTCADGSDETKETCNGILCPDYLYRCAYGACVVKNSRCNGVNECVDGSDEVGCPSITPTRTTPKPPVTPPVITDCPSYLFQCKYGACIPKNQVCDGQKNCADNSDEEPPNCNKNVTAGSCNSDVCSDDSGSGSLSPHPSTGSSSNH